MKEKPASIRKLIIVEDDPDDQYFLQTAFEKIGFEQHVAYLSSAQELFDYLETKAATTGYPLAILLDYNMPVMNGEAALVKLKENKEYADIQVLIYSTSISDAQVKTLVELGAEGCYTKSFSSSGIVDFAKLLQQKVETIYSGHPLK